MSNKILVAYASRTGTTAGVAEAIGKTLAESGAEVDVRAMADVKDLTPYRGRRRRQRHPGQAMAAGSHAVHADASGGVATKAFRRLSGVHDAGHEERRLSRRSGQLAAAGACLGPPVSEGLFAGALDISKVPTFRDRLMFRISVVTGVWSEGDHRDWEAIRAWAESIGPLLVV